MFVRKPTFAAIWLGEPFERSGSVPLIRASVRKLPGTRRPFVPPLTGRWSLRTREAATTGTFDVSRRLPRPPTPKRLPSASSKTAWDPAATGTVVVAAGPVAEAPDAKYSTTTLAAVAVVLTIRRSETNAVPLSPVAFTTVGKYVGTGLDAFRTPRTAPPGNSTVCVL